MTTGDEQPVAGRETGGPGKAAPVPGPGYAPVLGPRPLGGLADLAQLLGGEGPRSRKFLGGLAIGALVGAALAGGSLLRRRKGVGRR